MLLWEEKLACCPLWIWLAETCMGAQPCQKALENTGTPRLWKSGSGWWGKGWSLMIQYFRFGVHTQQDACCSSKISNSSCLAPYVPIYIHAKCCQIQAVVFNAPSPQGQMTPQTSNSAELSLLWVRYICSMYQGRSILHLCLLRS